MFIYKMLKLDSQKIKSKSCKPFLNFFAGFKFVEAWILIVAAILIFQPKNTWPNQQPPLNPKIGANWLPTGHARTYLDLSGEWSFKKRNEKEWHSLHVPSFLGKEGIFLFKRSFLIDSSFVNKSLQILALGVQQKCTVYLNNKFIGTHKGGNTSFLFELPNDAVHFHRSNEILLEVDTRLSIKSGLPLKLRPGGLPPAYGGLFGDIFLVALPNPGIKAVHASYELDAQLTSCQLCLDITLEDPLHKNSAISEVYVEEGKYEYLAELWRLGDRRPVAKSQSTKFEFGYTPTLTKRIILNIDKVELWSPREPFLYETRLFLLKNGQAVDELRFHIGFRKIDIADGKLEINNQPMQLLTIEWVEDLMVRNLNGDSLVNLIEEDMARIKELRANCVRVVGGQPHPALIAVCDRLGLFVLEEIPAINVPGQILAREDFRNRAKEIFREQITRDWNHPSILAWGIGCGFNPKNKETQAFVADLADVARNLDSRPIYAGVQGNHILSDFLSVDFEILELTTKQTFQFGAQATDNISERMTPALIASFSVPMIPYQNYLKHPQRGEEKQAFEMGAALGQYIKESWCAGVSVSAWRDWAGDSPNLIFGPRPGANWHISGIVDRYNSKRLSHSVVKAIFSSSSGPKLAIRPVETESPAVYPIIGLVVLLIFLFNFRSNRTLRKNLSRIFVHPHGFYVDRRENRRISVVHSLLIGTTVAITISLALSSLFYSLRDNTYLAQAMSFMFPEPHAAYRFLWLVWHPLGFITCSLACVSLVFVAFAIFLKIVSIIIRERLRFNQILMSVNWMVANLLFALPLAIVFYRALQRPKIGTLVILIFALTFLWSAVRVFRGTRVLLVFSTSKTWLLFSFSFAMVILIISMYLEHSRAFSEYVVYYVSLLR